MSSPVLRYPETPIIQPVSLWRKTNSSMSSEDLGSSDSSSSSPSAYQCRASPPTFADPVYASTANVTPFDREQEPSPKTLADSLLQTLEIQSTTSDYAQAIAVAPWDHRVTDQWVLINLLCHRIFATFEDQGCIRNLNTYFYQHLGPGQDLVITARRVAQSGLAWLEATIKTHDFLVAIGTALYDEPRPRYSREMSRLMKPDDLISDLHGLGASWDP